MGLDLFGHLRACMYCRAIGGAAGHICSRCWAEFADRQGPYVNEVNYPFSVRSLFVWDEKTALWVRPLIYKLKRDGNNRLWRTLAEKFLVGLPVEVLKNIPEIFVLPPRSSKHSKDHAWGWGRALSDICGVPLEDPLEFLEGLPQKRLRRAQRFHRRFEVRRGFRDYTGAKLVFVDDLVTTGATAAAAFTALKTSKSPGIYEEFSAWSLAQRPRLAGEVKF